ncbi:MAG: hypothetical protein Q8M16_14890, partial [Pirellulaceae bacterium]|nr:hypothetical protein [Pirellulaceae bacterium]
GFSRRVAEKSIFHCTRRLKPVHQRSLNYLCMGRAIEIRNLFRDKSLVFVAFFIMLDLYTRNNRCKSRETL